MKIRRVSLCILVALAFLWAATVLAEGRIAALHLFRSGEWIKAEVRAQHLLDERTRLTVESGLPGTCLYQLRLEDASGQAVVERYQELSLRLDLWENRYLLQEDDETRAWPSLAAADSALSHLANYALCPLSALQSGGEYHVVVQIAVRPLAPEDRRRLSRYVSRNSAAGSEEVALDLGALFSHILGEKGGSRRLIRYEGPPFRAADLKEGP